MNEDGKLVRFILLAVLVFIPSACGVTKNGYIAGSLEEATVLDSELEEEDMAEFDLELIGAKPKDFSNEELSVLYQQARYCQAMTEKDIDTMRELVSEDMLFTHMSGTHWYENRAGKWIETNGTKR